MVGWFGLFTRVTQPRCGYCLKASMTATVSLGLSCFTLAFDSSPIKGEGYMVVFRQVMCVCMLSFCMVYVRSI